MSHSPLPWRIGPVNAPNDAAHCGIESGGEMCMTVCDVWADADSESDHNTDLAQANAELIVTAVNAHAELLAALKDVVAALQKDAPGTPLNNHKYDALGARALAAIAKAEGATHVR